MINNTTLYFISVPFDNSYQNQLYFPTVTAQRTYFNSRIIADLTFSNLLPLRAQMANGKTASVVRLGKNIDDFSACNYIMYQNPYFSNKWFYAFILDFVYVNAECTDVYFETDVYQTWLAESTLMPSFVVREHVFADSPGDYLEPEGLDLGEYVSNYSVDGNMFKDLCIIIGTTVQMTSPYDGFAVGSYTDNVFSGLRLVAWDSSKWTQLSSKLNDIDVAGKGEGIKIVFMYPKAFLPIVDWTATDYHYLDVTMTAKVLSKSFTVFNSTTQFEGYTPKNSKLYTFPYRFLYVTNNQGQSAQYRYEYFNNQNNVIFQSRTSISPNPIVKMIPSDYKNEALNMDEALTLDGYPTCSWKYGVWENWYAQNRSSTALGYLSSAIQIGVGVAGMATGNPVGIMGITNGVLAVGGQMAEVEKAKMQPSTIKGNIGSASANIAMNKMDFTFIQKSITAEKAKQIDDYLSMFGYKVNAVKVPNIGTRKEWNYVKTIDVNIKGNIPMKDLQRLRQMYNDGVTFWRNPGNIYNYSLSNPTFV